MLGRTVGHYRITERIGAGGMGVVYLARDERLDRDVAVKVLREGTLDEASRRHFRNEARALSRSVHPSIATIHDFDTEDQIDYLVMEYIPGQSLDERLAAGALPERDVLRLGTQLADGLDAAHREGVVHRDLKPANLRITPEGRLKIIDFGLARFGRPNLDTTHSATGVGRPAGTLPYMAPEQLEGAEPDARADIYAAGAVLYEMATGRRPHPDRQEALLIRAILDAPPPPPSTFCRGLSPALEACIVKALDKDPERRYQSARELLVDLQRAAGGRAPDHRAPARRRSVRSRAAGATSAAILAVAIAIAGWSAWRARAPVVEPAPAPRARVAVLPASENAQGDEPGDWPLLAQALLAGELTGVEKLGVIDPSSLNALVNHEIGPGAPSAGQPLYPLLSDLGVTHVLLCQFLGSGDTRQLQANLVNPATGEITYSTRHDVAGAAALSTAASRIAGEVVAYLQLSSGELAASAEIRPWVSFAKHDLQAVRAFVQATQHLYANEPAEAERDLRRALDADPDLVPARLWLISLLEGAGRHDEAETHYRRLLDAEADASPFEQALIGYARALLDGRLDAQARHLEAALAYSPSNYILLANLADVRASQGDCASAVATLDPVVDAHWHYPPVYELWGWCAVVEGHFVRARSVLEDALSIQPVAPHVFALLEALAIASGDQDAAARYAARFASPARESGAMALDPAMALAYDRIAEDRLQAGGVEAAATLFQRAIDVAPGAAHRQVGLAVALRRLGRLDEAERACRAALAIDRDRADAYRELAEVAERRGDTAGAIAGFTEYLRLAPDGTDAAATRARLDRLQGPASRDDRETRRH